MKEKCSSFYNNKCNAKPLWSCRYSSRGSGCKLYNKNESVQFKLPTPLMIDQQEIKSSLTREKPLLFLEYNMNIYVHIHSSIQWKSQILKIQNTLPEAFGSELSALKSKWVEWVKKVKTSDWGEHKEQTTVNMIFPKI